MTEPALDFGQRLFLSDTIKDFLAAAFNAEHDRAAMRFGHRGKQMLRDRVDAPFATPMDRDSLVVDPLADRVDPFRLKQKVIINEGYGPIAELLEVCELGHDVLRTAGPPLPFIEYRDVTEYARPGAPA